MRHRWKGRKLQRTTAHRIALGRNLVTSLFTYGQIVTTPEKAKEFRGLADRVITWARKANANASQKLHYYRQILSVVTEERVARKVLNDIAKRFPETQAGGYTRVLRFGGSRWDGEGRGWVAFNRLGDNGGRALWELTVIKGRDEELTGAGRGKKARSDRMIAAFEKKKKKQAAAAAK
jgi:large subunit ribosomal protein L17